MFSPANVDLLPLKELRVVSGLGIQGEKPVLNEWEQAWSPGSMRTCTQRVNGHELSP